MKKITLLIAIVMAAIVANAQTNKEEVDLMQAAFGMEKKAIVAEFVKLTEAQSEAFWQIYDEYETQRKELGIKRLELLYQYAEKYMTMSNEEADEWTKAVMKLSASTDKLINTYYKKIKKVTSPIVATQFYQIENYILVGIRMEILEGIPFL